MAPRRHDTKGASSKEKEIKAWGHDPSANRNQPRTIEVSGSSSQQEPITGIQSPQQRKDQFLQTLYEMKKQMKEQQEQLDRKRDWMALDRENIL